MNTHKHTFSRSKPSATVETCTCGKFQFTEHAGPSIVAVEPETAQGKAQHSPLPWQDPDGKRIFCRDYSIAKTYGPNAEADAKLIVASVNHAQAMAEALRALIEPLGQDEIDDCWQYREAQQALRLGQRRDRHPLGLR